MITERELALICTLIYYNPPDNMLKRVGCCLTAGMMADSLINNPPKCADVSAESLMLIKSNCLVRELLITEYINHNDINGFVAFAFKSSMGFEVLAFRGSESDSGCAPNNVDWFDNIISPISGSIQYPDVESFINAHASGDVICTGHSKGGHNAMYAAAVSENPRAVAVCFDAQGFSLNQLSRVQKSRLRSRAVNYVYRRDIVGSLLCHPEKRVFVKGSREVNPHSLDALAFDLTGNLISSRQAIVPYLIGKATCALPLPAGSIGTRLAQSE